MSTRLFLQSQKPRKSEPTQPLLTFRIQQEWFALPIFTVEKVIPMGNINEHSRETGVSFTNYQNQKLWVINLGQILGQLNLKLADSPFLLILSTTTKQKFGLPIDSLPVLDQVLESAFLPIPESDLSQKNLICLSDCLIQIPERPPLFLLNLEKVLAQMTN